MSDETRPDADSESVEAPGQRPRATEDDDVEGHIGARFRVAGEDATGEDDDVEGHTSRRT